MGTTAILTVATVLGVGVGVTCLVWWLCRRGYRATNSNLIDPVKK